LRQKQQYSVGPLNRSRVRTWRLSPRFSDAGGVVVVIVCFEDFLQQAELCFHDLALAHGSNAAEEHVEGLKQVALWRAVIGQCIDALDQLVIAQLLEVPQLHDSKVLPDRV
jgi:hypothetical protein